VLLLVRRYHYPEKRQVKGTNAGDAPAGVPGEVELLNARIVSSQPVVAFDWHADKEGLACAAALDQTARVLIVTKLEKY